MVDLRVSAWEPRWSPIMRRKNRASKLEPNQNSFAAASERRRAFTAGPNAFFATAPRPAWSEVVPQLGVPRGDGAMVLFQVNTTMLAVTNHSIVFDAPTIPRMLKELLTQGISPQL
jgi:hypothetical protein